MSSETQPPRDAGTQREADVYDLLAWLEVNKRKVATVAVVLVLIGFAIATMRYLRQQKEEKASGALLALKPTLTPQTNVPPPQASALLKVAEDFRGTGAAKRARILAATAYFTEARYAEAEKAFSDFVKDHPESEWVASAAYGIATAQEAQNKINEALNSYQTVATAYANTSVADDAKLALARIYEMQKKPDQALRLYNELLVPPPGGQPGQMGNPTALQKKETLLRHHPELNTNLTARPLPPILPPAGTNAASSVVPTNAAATELPAPTTTPAAPAVSVPATNASPAPDSPEK